MLCKSVPLKYRLKTAANQNIRACFFPPYDALLLGWKTVMMYEVPLPLSPKIGQSVYNWGVVIVNQPDSQAAVCILDVARFRVMTTV